MFVGMCTCGNCRYCGYQWAPPLTERWTTTRLTFDHEKIQRSLVRLNARLMKPRFKRHADGSCTPLPSHAALMMGALR